MLRLDDMLYATDSTYIIWYGIIWMVDGRCLKTKLCCERRSAASIRRTQQRQRERDENTTQHKKHTHIAPPPAPAPRHHRDAMMRDAHNNARALLGLAAIS
jgi:hypothetical protein